jgi:hypothetical protein
VEIMLSGPPEIDFADGDRRKVQGAHHRPSTSSVGKVESATASGIAGSILQNSCILNLGSVCMTSEMSRSSSTAGHNGSSDAVTELSGV